MPASGKTIMVLGGGMGGLAAVHELRKRLPKEHRVVLVERRTKAVCQPMLVWVALGITNPPDAETEYSSLAAHGIQVIRADVHRIHPEGKTVETDKGLLRFDYAVVALGAETDLRAITGLYENGFSFYDLGEAARMHSAVDHFDGGELAIVLSQLPISRPIAPYEMVFLLEDMMRFRKIRQHVTFSFYTPESVPLADIGATAIPYLERLLEKKSIQFHPNHTIRQASVRELTFTSDEKQSFDFLVFVPPMRASEVVRKSVIANERGWISVHPQTLQTKFSGMYAVGDCAEITLPNGNFLPKDGSFAHLQGEAAAHNIVLDILGRKERESYNGFGSFFIETGGGKSGYLSGYFYEKPEPKIRVWNPTAPTRWAKLFFMHYWKWKWF